MAQSQQKNVVQQIRKSTRKLILKQRTELKLKTLLERKKYNRKITETRAGARH